MIYSTHELYAALKTIIPNIPTGCSELTLKLSTWLDLPTMEVAIHARRSVEDDTVKYLRAEKFYVISEKNLAEVKRAMAELPDEQGSWAEVKRAIANLPDEQGRTE